MWPWGHLAFGYLLGSGWTRSRFGRPPGNREAILLAVGTQLPDLVDKPLAWTFSILPNGRSLGHSLLVSLAVVAIVGWVFSRRGRPSQGTVFGIGLLSHLAGDALHPALAGEFYYLGFLGYPLLPPIVYPEESTSILAHFAALEFTPLFGTELAFALLVGVVWLFDGMPGLPSTKSAETA